MCAVEEWNVGPSVDKAPSINVIISMHIGCVKLKILILMTTRTNRSILSAALLERHKWIFY